jgi:hypothetical protein
MNMMSSMTMGGTSQSPRTMMDQKIQAGVQSGSISQTDETALETALDSIDSATGVGSTSTAATPTNKLDPSKVGDRIDDLIDEQVKAGKLTQDQANTLQTLFAQNPPPPGGGNGTSADASDDTATKGVGGASGGGHVHGMHHHKGPPPATETADGSDSDSDADDILSTITGTSTASSSSSSSGSSSSDSSGDTDQTKALDSLIAFLNNMRDKINSGGTYGASGSSSSASSSSTAATGLVVNSYA